MANTFVSLRRLQWFYNGLKNKFALKSDVPSKTSDLTNDSGFLTSHQDISGKVNVYQGTANQNKYLGINESGNVEPRSITVDSALSATSTNPVQNKVIKSALDAKLNSSDILDQIMVDSDMPIKSVAVTDYFASYEAVMFSLIRSGNLVSINRGFFAMYSTFTEGAGKAFFVMPNSQSDVVVLSIDRLDVSQGKIYLSSVVDSTLYEVVLTGSGQGSMAGTVKTTLLNGKPLSGKTVVCFGDSLFGMYRGDDSAPAFVADETGATVYNVGFGGCRMSVHPTHGYAEFSMWALAKAVAENDFTAQDQYASQGSDYFASQLAILKSIDFSTIDYVVIHYGTNDFQGQVPLDDANHTDDYNTICGALRYSLNKLMTAFPNLQILVSMPVFRYWTSGSENTYSDTYTRNGITLPDVVNALMNVCYAFEVPVINGYRGMGINKYNASAYYTDGTHHNLAGRERFGRYIGKNLITPIPAVYIGSDGGGDTPAYTNLLPSATDSSGNIYNGTGYKAGYRVNSSGAEVEDSAFVLSGFIPVNYLDVVYLQNVTYNSAASNASSQRICFYDANKSFIRGCISGANSTAQLGKQYDSNNNITQFTVTNVSQYSAENAKFFRICGSYIGADSIITVGEPITN